MARYDFSESAYSTVIERLRDSSCCESDLCAVQRNQMHTWMVLVLARRAAAFFPFCQSPEQTKTQKADNGDEVTNMYQHSVFSYKLLASDTGRLESVERAVTTW